MVSIEKCSTAQDSISPKETSRTNNGGFLTKKMECIEKQQVPFPLQVTACGKGNGIIPFADFCTAGQG